MREEYIFTQGCLLPGVLINGGAYTRGCLYPGAVFILAGAYMQCPRGAYCPGVLILWCTYTRWYVYPVVRIPGGTYTRGCLYSEVFILAAGYMVWYSRVLMSRGTYSWGSLYPQSSFSRGACTRLYVQDNDCIFIKLLLNITQTSHIFFFVLSR